MATRVPLPPSKDAPSSFPAGLLQLTWLVLLLGLVASASVRAQDPRDAMVARAFNEFDAARRLQLLMSALNPTAGPPRGAQGAAAGGEAHAGTGRRAAKEEGIPGRAGRAGSRGGGGAGGHSRRRREQVDTAATNRKHHHHFPL